MLRGNPLDVRNEAWANKVVALERVGRFGTDSCSPTGLGGFTGCTQAPARGRARRTARRTDKTDWQAMIADERAKRIAGIDAAADEVEAAVVAEERALAERQKAAEELERQASGQAPAPTAPDEADAEPLPTAAEALKPGRFGPAPSAPIPPVLQHFCDPPRFGCESAVN